MAHKATAPEGLYTALADVFLHVAPGAIIHFHPIPAVAFNARNVVPPDIAAVAADPVVLIGSQLFALADVTVAGNAVHSGLLDMRGVREIDTGGLL
jgi:hypothetical protein